MTEQSVNIIAVRALLMELDILLSKKKSADGLHVYVLGDECMSLTSKEEKDTALLAFGLSTRLMGIYRAMNKKVAA